uniref:uncharacterized protein LOC120329101 n=1 Tax=Styela clava TaxID=7725 RepID=UPI0019396871|nr:uncharacterized protein LOC120329101 [Styela clava]
MVTICIMSRMVRRGNLECLQKNGHRSFIRYSHTNRGFAALEGFILNSNKWFDCMNSGFQNKNAEPSRQPFYNIYDKRLEWLEKDFLKYLDDWEEKAYAYSRPLVGEVDRQKMLLSDATRNA